MENGMITIENCTLVIDRSRGVIWVNGDAAALLRICNLPTPIPNPLEGADGFPRILDVTHMVGVDWRGRMNERIIRVNGAL